MCLRAQMLNMLHACVLTYLVCSSLLCLRVCVLGVLTSLRVWHTYELACLACLCLQCLSVYVLITPACFMSLYTHMFYILTVLKYLMRLHACVLVLFVCFIYFTFEKLGFKNSYIKEFGFY